jgi:adenosyl cobinamide kinase/adenosyl cobinamide phosphate guanylyltransferase
MLTLIIGGRNSGKYEYLLSLGYKPCDIGANFEKKVIYKLNDIIKNLIDNNIDPVEHIKNKLEELKDIIIVCDEVGSGVVHIDRKQREYIEAVGRALCIIAKKSDRVDRVYCGIITRIKG